MTDPVGMTLSRYIHEVERRHVGARGEFSDLLEAIGLAGRVIGATVRKAGLANVLGLAGATNVQGEAVKKIDVLANEAMIAALDHSGRACVLVSEEEKEIVVIPTDRAGDYAVAFDPLDGSGNIDTNMPLGTIFSIYRRVTPPGVPGSEADLLRRGSEQVAAGYILYGSATMLVYACDEGTHGFTLDPLVGTWLSTHPGMRIPARGRSWSANAGNRVYWKPGVREYVAGLEAVDASKGRPYGQRYTGALVADVHRLLLEGGIHMYPADTKDPSKPSGKLRILYECAPLAHVVEQAGGAATDGRHRLLDVPISKLHQRTPLFIGSRDDVAEATELASRDSG
jgi:fructose-1,6-bisphosphatase I